MRFQDKLKRLAQGVNKSKAGATVGLKANTISTYAATGSIPRADIGLRIARALKVPSDWLFDDSQGWPPPSPGRAPDARSLSDLELMEEVARRRDLAMSDWLRSIERVEKIDWANVRRRLAASPGDIPPDVIAQLAPAAEAARIWVRVSKQFDLRFYDMLLGKMTAAGRMGRHTVATSAARYEQALHGVDFMAVADDVKRRPNAAELGMIDMPTWRDVLAVEGSDAAGENAEKPPKKP